MNLRSAALGSWWPGFLLLLCAAALSIFLMAPLGTLLLGSVVDEQWHWSLSRFAEFAATPGVGEAIWNTLWVAALVTLITVPLAFVYAYAIQRACVPLKGVWRLIGVSALMGPSLIGAISFIQWFGNQGVFKSWLGGYTVYGPIGITMATVYASFPHALMLLVVALATTDGWLYEAADALGASRWRKFMTITLPSAKYGLISACMVVFSYSVSEFGIPKVIGGNFPVLAVEIYIQVVGMHNFGRGAVVALLLLVPVLVAFVADWHVQRKQQSTLTARAVPYVPRPDWRRDAPLVRFWPYNLELTLDHYIFGLSEAGVLSAYLNSLKIAALTTLVGTPFIFATAYLVDKTHVGPTWLRPAVRAMATLPMGVPGLVLGIGYILFFNAPSNPLNGLYQTLAIMVVANVVHYYTACHLTAMTSLKSIDREFEAVSASLGVSQLTTFRRVTLPICLPAVLEIARYLFINAMTTVSALVFLYSPDTMTASIAILHLDESGDLGSAAAMATLIVLTTLTVSVLYSIATHLLLRRHQVWRGLTR